MLTLNFLRREETSRIILQEENKIQSLFGIIEATLQQQCHLPVFLLRLILGLILLTWNMPVGGRPQAS